MIAIGTDPHKQSHTAAALDAQQAQCVDELTVAAREEGHERLLSWARSLDDERVWAIEDCRHVSGRLERFLLRSGERVVRVPPKLMAGARRGARELGKSDALDAKAVARAAIREGLETLPEARLQGPEREFALLLDHREDLVAERTRIQNRLRWHLHELDPGIELRERSLDQPSTLKWLSGRLRRTEQTTLVRICRELVRRCSELSRRATELERELGALVRRLAPQLLVVPGCGPLTAAKLIAEVASSASPRTPSSPCSPASLRSTPPRVSSDATASTARATASSTWRCTGSRSPRPVSTRRRGNTSPAGEPRARPTARRFGRSSATSPAASFASSP
jgi:transposase